MKNDLPAKRLLRVVMIRRLIHDDHAEVIDNRDSPECDLDWYMERLKRPGFWRSMGRPTHLYAHFEDHTDPVEVLVPPPSDL